MNILFVTDQYKPQVNGIATQVSTLRAEIQKRGHRVLVVAPKPRADWVETEEDVLRLNSYVFPLRKVDRWIVPFNKKMEDYLLKQNIDIVHNHLILTGFIGTRVAKKLGIPKIATLHTLATMYARYTLPLLPGFVDPMIHFLTRKYFSSYDLVLAPSEKAIVELEKAKIGSKSKLLYNGINLSFFQKASKEEFLKKFELDENRPLAIIVGRVDKGKNVDLAIHAINYVKKSIPNVQLAIIGDGLERARMENLIKNLELEDSVLITGYIPPSLVASAYKAAKLSLFTSEVDSLPTVLIEAASAGNPIVTVDDKAVEAIVKNNSNGMITSNSPEELGEAVVSLLSNPELQEKFSAESVKLAEAFSIENYVDNLLSIYSGLIADYGKRAQTS